MPYWQSKETETGGFGWQTEQRWRDTIDVARKLGLIETALKTEDVFVNTYLSQIDAEPHGAERASCDGRPELADQILT